MIMVCFSSLNLKMSLAVFHFLIFSAYCDRVGVVIAFFFLLDPSQIPKYTKSNFLCVFCV